MSKLSIDNTLNVLGTDPLCLYMQEMGKFSLEDLIQEGNLVIRRWGRF